jgi:hypothetical protein
MRLRLIIPSALAVLLAACAGTAAQQGFPTLPPMRLAPTWTLTPTQRATAAETPTATSAPSATVAPSFTPPPAGPWCPIPDAPVKSSGGEVQLAVIGDRKAQVWSESTSWTPVAETDTGNNANYFHWIGFSDDGAYVAWTVIPEQDQVELWARRLPDGESRRLIDPQWFSSMGNHPTKAVVPMDLHWVPGTHTIGFHTNLAPTYLGFCYTPDNLWWIDADTGKAVSKKVDGEIFYSPDGKLAAGVNQKTTFLMNADATHIVPVPIPDYHTTQYNPTYRQPPRIRWAADSRSFLVLAPDAKSLMDQNPKLTVWQVRVDDPTPALFNVWTTTSVFFSPNHQWAAIERPLPGTDRRVKLDLLRANGTQETFYHEMDVNGTVVWSPDSTRFIFWDGQIPYLGGLCNAPSPLLSQSPADSASELKAVWIDSARYLLIAGTSEEQYLYLGDLSTPEKPPRQVFPSSVVVFDWRIAK